MKHYAKKREAVRAVQWTGAMTADVSELVGERKISIDGDIHQLVLGNGWYARVGDWIYSASGEDLSVLSDEVFRKIYEEVDGSGRALSPTDDEHETAGQEFAQKLDELLVAGLRLSREDHPAIFRGRDQLLRALRGLLQDHGYVAERRELARIREKIKKELWP